MNRLIPLIPILAVLIIGACGGDDNRPTIGPTTIAPYSQLDLVVGTGAVAVAGSQVTVAYGNASPGPSIPPNATLVFDITLTNVQ